MSVAVPVPALGVLTYRVPDDQQMPRAGARVVVPVGPRTLTGVVLGEAAAADTAYTIKPIKHVVDDHAFVPPDVVKLTEWVSEYYLAGPGATLAAALPPHGLTARIDRFKTVRVAALTAAGIDAAERLAAHSGEPAEVPRLGKRQVEALQLLRGAPDGLPASALAERGITSPALARLKTLGLVAIRERSRRSRSVRARGVGDRARTAVASRPPISGARSINCCRWRGVARSTWR